MTKTDIAKNMAAEADLSTNQAKEFVNATLEAIQEALVEGERVTLVGFGTFDVRERASRKGVNPQTGEPMTIPAMKVVNFRVGKTLKEAVRDA